MQALQESKVCKVLKLPSILVPATLRMKDLFYISSKFVMRFYKALSSVFILNGIVNHGDHILCNSLCFISGRILSSPLPFLPRLMNPYLSASSPTFQPFPHFHCSCLGFPPISHISSRFQRPKLYLVLVFVSAGQEDDYLDIRMLLFFFLRIDLWT